LLLLISEIGFSYGDDVIRVEISIRHVDLDDESESVPLRVPKDVLMQKWICKHKGLIPDSILRHASRFDVTTDKGDNSNTLFSTTAMRPDATAKWYSRGT